MAKQKSIISAFLIQATQVTTIRLKMRTRIYIYRKICLCNWHNKTRLYFRARLLHLLICWQWMRAIQVKNFFTFIAESLISNYVDSKDVNIIHAQSLPATNQKVLDNEIIFRTFRIFHVRLVCNKKFYRNISALRQERLYRQGSTDECYWSWSWRRVQCKNGFIFYNLLI